MAHSWLVPTALVLGADIGNVLGDFRNASTANRRPATAAGRSGPSVMESGAVDATGRASPPQTWARRGTVQIGRAGNLAKGFATVGAKTLKNTLCNMSCCGYKIEFGQMDLVRAAHWRRLLPGRCRNRAYANG